MNQTIKEFSYLGSYGMGGPGWRGLELENGLVMIYEMWDSDHWVFQDGEVTKSYSIEKVLAKNKGNPWPSLGLKIVKVQLENTLLRLICETPEGKQSIIEASEETCGLEEKRSHYPWQERVKGKTMPELWRVGYADSSYWCF